MADQRPLHGYDERDGLDIHVKGGMEPEQ